VCGDRAASSGQPLQFNGQDLTANLPKARVTTITANPFEPGVLYAGTAGRVQGCA
jgi:hypothetical protein